MRKNENAMNTVMTHSHIKKKNIKKQKDIYLSKSDILPKASMKNKNNNSPDIHQPDLQYGHTLVGHDLNSSIGTLSRLNTLNPYIRKTQLNDISYSMIVDRDIEPRVMKRKSSIKPRKIHYWVGDASNCNNCNVLFTILLRKHHCRLCGRIFCYDCCSNWIKIPEYMELPKNIVHYDINIMKILGMSGQEERVCEKCYNDIIEMKKIRQHTNMFNLIDLTVVDYNVVKCVCKEWRKIANMYLSDFREIQYLLPNNVANSQQKKMLWNNRFLFQGHSKWTLQFLKSIDWIGLSTKDENWINLLLYSNTKTCDCWKLMCTRDCETKLNGFDSLELLQLHIVNTNIIKFSLKCLDICPYYELSCYVTFLVFNLRYDIDNLISKFLLEKSKKNDHFANDLYWELVLFLTDTEYNKIYKRMINILKTNITSNHKLITIMKSLKERKNMDEIRKIIKNNITSIINSNVKITINTDDIEIKNSATRPIIIPYSLDNNKSISKIMFKYDDIRKEHIIMNIIKLIDVILKRENVNLNITKYKIHPVDIECGFIEIITNAETLYDINEKFKFSIQNYIFENNNNISIDKIRKNFMTSCAAYCLISYLLGIGDRHLDNIMITNNGLIFHIDFNYILGSDPKPLTPEIRLTEEMIDCMGGRNSKYYKEFQSICSKSYNILRRHTNIFLIMLSMLTHIRPEIDNGKFTEEFLEDQIIKRFIPGETYEDAKIQYITKISDHSGTSHFPIDFCHHQKKKNVNKLQYFLSNSISTVYSYFTGSNTNFVS